MKGQGNPLLGCQCLADRLAVELHQLATVAGHLLEEKSVLLLGQTPTALKLTSEGGEDVSVHAAEAHGVVVLDVRPILLVGSLVLEDRQEASVRPAHVGSEFVLKGFECVGFIHNPYTIGVLNGQGNSIFQDQADRNRPEQYDPHHDPNPHQRSFPPTHSSSPTFLCVDTWFSL